MASLVSPTISILMNDIIELLKDKDYIWFRFTWSKVGNQTPRWVVWLETLNGVTLSYSHIHLSSALEHLLNTLRDCKCPV
jgi:hypothetical protein